MKNLLKILTIIGIISMLIITAVGCVEATSPSDTEASTLTELTIDNEKTPESATEITIDATDAESIPAPSFNSTVFKNAYAEIYITQPRWIDDGWYVSFNCYNNSNKNFDFMIAIASINGEVQPNGGWDNAFVWDTVYTDSDKNFKLKISEDPTSIITTISLNYEVFITGTDDPSIGTITIVENQPVNFK